MSVQEIAREGGYCPGPGESKFTTPQRTETVYSRDKEGGVVFDLICARLQPFSMCDADDGARPCFKLTARESVKSPEEKIIRVEADAGIIVFRPEENIVEEFPGLEGSTELPPAAGVAMGLLCRTKGSVGIRTIFQATHPDDIFVPETLNGVEWTMSDLRKRLGPMGKKVIKTYRSVRGRETRYGIVRPQRKKS